MRKVTCLLKVLFWLFVCVPAAADVPSVHILPGDLVREAIANNPDFYAPHYSIPCYRIVGHICVTKMHWEWMHSSADRGLHCLQHAPSDQQGPCPIDALPSYAWSPD